MESQAGVSRQNKYSKLLLNIFPLFHSTALSKSPQCWNSPRAPGDAGSIFPSWSALEEQLLNDILTSLCHLKPASARLPPSCVCVHIPAPSTKPDFCTSLLFIAEMQNSEKLLKTWKINLGVLTPSSDSSAPAICVTQDAAKNGSRKWIRANNFFVQLQYAPKMDSVLYYIKGVLALILQ